MIAPDYYLARRFVFLFQGNSDEEKSDSSSLSGDLRKCDSLSPPSLTPPGTLLEQNLDVIDIDQTVQYEAPNEQGYNTPPSQFDDAYSSADQDFLNNGTTDHDTFTGEFNSFYLNTWAEGSSELFVFPSVWRKLSTLLNSIKLLDGFL